MPAAIVMEQPAAEVKAARSANSGPQIVILDPRSGDVIGSFDLPRGARADGLSEFRPGATVAAQHPPMCLPTDGAPEISSGITRQPELRAASPEVIARANACREMEQDDSFSGRVLKMFDALGAWSERNGFGPKKSEAAERAESAISEGGLSHELREKVAHESVRGQETNLRFDVKYNHRQGPLPEIVQSPLKPGIWSKALHGVAQAADAVFGVLSVAAEFHHDRQICDSTYRGTMKEMILSGAQIAVGAGTGALVAAYTGGLAYGMGLSAAALVPGAVIVAGGLAAGAGASYLVGQAFDYLREWWK